MNRRLLVLEVRVKSIPFHSHWDPEKLYRSGNGSANTIKTKSENVHIIPLWLGCLKLCKLMTLSIYIRSLAVLLVHYEHKHDVKGLMLQIILLAMHLWSDAVGLWYQICHINLYYDAFLIHNKCYVHTSSLKCTLISKVILVFWKKNLMYFTVLMQNCIS